MHKPKTGQLQHAELLVVHGDVALVHTWLLLRQFVAHYQVVSSLVHGWELIAQVLCNNSLC